MAAINALMHDYDVTHGKSSAACFLKCAIFLFSCFSFIVKNQTKVRGEQEIILEM